VRPDKLRDAGIVQVICPTCQDGFAGRAPAEIGRPATLHGVVFDILGWGGLSFAAGTRPSSLSLRSSYAGHHASPSVSARLRHA